MSEIKGRGQWDCLGCGYHFSVTAGTIMHDSHLPLRKWFAAVYLMCKSRKGLSANQLKRTLGIGSYQTAWHLCHLHPRGHGQTIPSPAVRRCSTSSKWMKRWSAASGADAALAAAPVRPGWPGRFSGAGPSGSISRKTQKLISAAPRDELSSSAQALLGPVRSKNEIVGVTARSCSPRLTDRSSATSHRAPGDSVCGGRARRTRARPAGRAGCGHGGGTGALVHGSSLSASDRRCPGYRDGRRLMIST